MRRLALAALFAIAGVGCAGDAARPPPATGAAPVADHARLFAILDGVPAYDATPDPSALNNTYDDISNYNNRSGGK